MNIAFAALETFNPSYGESWEKYIAWSKLTHLREVVSHDSILCPSVIKKPIDEDWDHMAYADLSPYLFSDLDYLIQRVGHIDKQVQIIATAREPKKDAIHSFCDARFKFKGFDLVDDALGTSALVNCGGFEEVFAPADLSECGLIEDYEKAFTVRELLLKHYPEEHHADCEVWAVWKWRATSSRHFTLFEPDEVRD
jgi:hypothetical protein